MHSFSVTQVLTRESLWISPFLMVAVCLSFVFVGLIKLKHTIFSNSFFVVSKCFKQLLVLQASAPINSLACSTIWPFNLHSLSEGNLYSLKWCKLAARLSPASFSQLMMSNGCIISVFCTYTVSSFGSRFCTVRALEFASGTPPSRAGPPVPIPIL